MNLKYFFQERLPAYFFNPLYATYQRILSLFISKSNAELNFWRKKYRAESNNFQNSHYRPLMLAMAAETDENFIRNKIIADFGCGPRGSLVWAKEALMRIGIDVLVDKYFDYFADNMISHGMIYVKCTENTIPVPTGSIDVLFTLNAMDHTDSFPKMCSEIFRILKPGGELIGSFNLGEPTTVCEPQTLTAELIKTNLLINFSIISYRISNKGPYQNPYGPLLEGKQSYHEGEEGYLWVRAKKVLLGAV